MQSKKFKNTSPVQLDVLNEPERLEDLVKGHDVVVRSVVVNDIKVIRFIYSYLLFRAYMFIKKKHIVVRFEFFFHCCYSFFLLKA